MAADEARAERIRALYEERKEENPRFTWRAIAEHVGVSERAAHAWGKTGGINPEHVPKLAEILQADRDYIWRGPRPEETPDLMDITARAEQLDDVDAKFSARVDDVEAQLKHIEDTILQQLEAQTRLLEDIRLIVGGENAFEALREFAEAVVPEEPETAAEQPPARKRPARRSRRAG